MSDRPDPESKTEQASEKRINEALEKGNVPISREVSTFGFLAALLICNYAVIDYSATRLGGTLSLLIEQPSQWEIATTGDVVAIGRALATSMTLALAPVLAIFLLIGLATSIVQMPPRFNFEKLKPDPSRLSPRQGWKRIVGAQGGLELVKALAKLGILAAVGVVGFATDWFGIAAALQAPPNELPARLLAAANTMLVTILLIAGLFSVLDLLAVRFMWQKDLRMTKQEVQDEHKQAEGDPHFKARRRSVAQSRSRQRMLASVPRATVVVANPTHYAVALSYQRAQGGAPKVVAKGRDLLALKIREIAEANDIPVVTDRELARALHQKVEVDQALPPEFYRVVADLLLALQKRGRIRL